MSKTTLEDFRFMCDFCANKKPFKKLLQIPLRIDKKAKHQLLFGFICDECSDENKRVTVNNQKVRAFTGRAKNIDDKNVFEEINDGGE